MLRVLVPVLSIALTVFALADCVQTDEEKTRGIPKWAWILLIVLLPWVGPFTWLVAGKDRFGGDGVKQPRREGPLAPDEDPEFLRRLDEDIRRERRERMRREREERENTGSDGTARTGDGEGSEDLGRGDEDDTDRPDRPDQG